ncbi:hypothetical protein G3436_08030 [Pseudomonas sp. MAFF212427]|uniref:Uncharacterized protein n=1 Tax=Pseudomonas brassicae TaxID=2708063 RepID=A0A6B3NKU1_9PSED|nr:hypothetical protein [Pseudomonas brassicae]NER63855.1 hypothetical protein [Pseudomonas brassicae]
MSLQVIWGLFAAHPAKLINLLALLITCPGGLLLQAARGVARRRWRGWRGMSLLVEGMNLRVNRFYYIMGFACLAMALLLSWFSTWI